MDSRRNSGEIQPKDGKKQKSIKNSKKTKRQNASVDIDHIINGPAKSNKQLTPMKKGDWRQNDKGVLLALKPLENLIESQRRSDQIPSKVTTTRRGKDPSPANDSLMAQ